MRLSGKVALITGSARGMGAIEAELFSDQGATVVITDVLETLGKDLESKLTGRGRKTLFTKLDVTCEENWVKVTKEIMDNFGRIDILINNAGIYSTTPIESTSIEEWNHVMSVNVSGIFLGTKHCAPHMRKGGGGSIVNLSSTAGLIGGYRGGAYGSSKGAVRLFTKNTALQFAKDGIRANSVHPGPIDTEMIAENLSTPEGRYASISRIPLGRLGTALDVAYGVLFLASDEASFLTGSELIIDGGVTAQ